MREELSMIDRIFGRLADVINHHPKRVAIVLGIVFIIALYSVTLITMETGNDTYLDKNSPEGILNNHYFDTFSSNALILIVETSDPLSPQVLSYIDGLEQDINQQENVVGSASVADLLKSANGGGTATVKRRDKQYCCPDTSGSKINRHPVKRTDTGSDHPFTRIV